MNVQITAPVYVDEDEDVLTAYTEMLGLIERLHRQLIDVVKRALDASSVHEVNAVQAMMLFNIGESTLPVGELISRGYYKGTNVSYNLKKLTEMGYVTCEKSLSDRRVVRVSTTKKADKIRLVVASVFQRHAQEITGPDRLGRKGLDKVRRGLLSLQSYWNEEIRAHI